MDLADRLTACRLESERLVLEPLSIEHADELAPVLDDISLHQFIGGEPAAVAELRARYARHARGQSPDGHQHWLNWAVRDRQTDLAVGTVQATVGAHEPHVTELAWVVGSAHQGRGFAKEAVALVAAWLGTRGVRDLRAHIHPHHDASMAVARSIALCANGHHRGRRGPLAVVKASAQSVASTARPSSVDLVKRFNF